MKHPASLDGKPKGSHDTVHRFVLPSNCPATVSGIIPPAGCGCMQPSTCNEWRRHRMVSATTTVAVDCREQLCAQIRSL